MNPAPTILPPADSAPAIVSDSNIALPQNLAKGLPLFTAPLELHIGGQTYADGVDITPSRFYELLDSGEQPKTSAPTPGAFLRAFQQAQSRSNNIICITISSNLSAAYNSAAEAASLAASQLPTLHITLIDSRTASAAQALIALDAARAAARNAPLHETLHIIQQRIAHTILFGSLGSMRHLSRSGRIPLPLFWIASLLNVKPVLQLSNGTIRMIDRPRSDARALQRIVRLAERRLDGSPARIAVIHANAPEKAQRLANALRQTLPIQELFTAELTPVIGAHTGPGLVGCALQPANRDPNPAPPPNPNDPPQTPPPSPTDKVSSPETPSPQNPQPRTP